MREKAFDSLKIDINSRSASFSLLEMLKLWKCLFQCMWMCDKRLVQNEFSLSLAKLLSAFVNREDSLLFLDCFWLTMAREWYGIDRLRFVSHAISPPRCLSRMNKYYFLMRQILLQSLFFLQNHKWDAELMAQWIPKLFFASSKYLRDEILTLSLVSFL